MARKFSSKAATTAPATAESMPAVERGNAGDVVLTAEEVAEFLKVPRSWVFEKTRARCKNRLPFLRIGRYLRFWKSEISDWLKNQGAGGPA
jgi:excisionase family DNA binding protein